MAEMSDKHSLDRAADAVDGVGKLAALLDVTPQAICNWKKRGVPIDRCVSIERATGGRVGRKDLRPDDWADHWPELTADAGATLPTGIAADRRDPTRLSPYAGTDIDRRAPAGEI